MAKETAEKKKNKKELSDIEKQISNMIKKYNSLANKGQFETRLGMVSASICLDELEDDDGNPIDKMPKNIDKYVEENEVYPGCSIDGFNAEAWFPSAICPGY